MNALKVLFESSITLWCYDAYVHRYDGNFVPSLMNINLSCPCYFPTHLFIYLEH